MKPKRRLSAFVVSDDEESKSISLTEESDLGDSDTEDSDAGDIPYDDGLPRQTVSWLFCSVPESTANVGRSSSIDHHPRIPPIVTPVLSRL